MTENMQHNDWLDTIALGKEKNVDESSRKSNHSLRRIFKTNDETLFNDAIQYSDIAEEIPQQTKSRSIRSIHFDEIEFESGTLKHTPSSDSLYSRGSRNLSRHSPVGSYRNIETSAIAHSPLAKRNNRDGVNITMLFGFAIGIACGIVFNIAEVYLKWFQGKITDTQMHFFGGKSIQSFYIEEESVRKNILYVPLIGFTITLQLIVYIILIIICFLKKPAPKTLGKNIMLHYEYE